MLSRVGGPPNRVHKPLGLARVCLSEAAFARRKRRKAAGGNRKWTIPPGPPLVPMRCEKRLQSWAALVAEGSLEYLHKAEAPLCKVAARVPLRVSMQPQCPMNGRLASLLIEGFTLVTNKTPPHRGRRRMVTRIFTKSSYRPALTISLRKSSTPMVQEATTSVSPGLAAMAMASFRVLPVMKAQKPAACSYHSLPMGEMPFMP